MRIGEPQLVESLNTYGCRVVQHGRAAVSAERRTDVEQSQFESGHGNKHYTITTKKIRL